MTYGIIDNLRPRHILILKELSVKGEMVARDMTYTSMGDIYRHLAELVNAKFASFSYIRNNNELSSRKYVKVFRITKMGKKEIRVVK